MTQLRSIKDIIQTPKFKKGDKAYYIGEEGHRIFRHGVPYEVVESHVRYSTKSLWNLGLKLQNNQIIYWSSEDFLSEKEYNKITKEDDQDMGIVSDLKAGDTVYYIGPLDKTFEHGRLYVLFKYQKEIIGKTFFEINCWDRAKNQDRWVTVEKSFADKNFVTEEQFKKTIKKVTLDDILKKGKFKTGNKVYYDGPGDKGFDYDIPYTLCANRADDKIWDVFVRLKGEKHGTWKFPTKEFVENNFLTEDEYKITGKTTPKTVLQTSYKDFSRFKEGDTVYYMGDVDKKSKIELPDEIGGLKTGKKLDRDKPYVIDFYNRSAGMIRVKGVNYSHPEKDFATAEEYERLRSLDDKPPTLGEEEIGVRKNDITLKLQILRDTIDKKLTWTRPYKVPYDYFRTIIPLNDPPNSQLRIDLKKPNEEWQMAIYYHRNPNPISKIGGEVAITVMELKESPGVIKIAKKVEALVEEEELNSSNDEEDRISWD